jgi:hypothetical protein
MQVDILLLKMAWYAEGGCVVLTAEISTPDTDIMGVLYVQRYFRKIIIILQSIWVIHRVLSSANFSIFSKAVKNFYSIHRKPCIRLQYLNKDSLTHSKSSFKV